MQWSASAKQRSCSRNLRGYVSKYVASGSSTMATPWTRLTNARDSGLQIPISSEYEHFFLFFAASCRCSPYPCVADSPMTNFPQRKNSTRAKLQKKSVCLTVCLLLFAICLSVVTASYNGPLTGDALLTHKIKRDRYVL